MNTTLYPAAEGQMRTDSLACGSVLVTLLAGVVSVVMLLM